MVTICKQKYTKILTAALSSLTFPIFHLVICSLLLTFRASRAAPETVEGGSKNSRARKLGVPDMSSHVFNILSLNMHEIKYFRLQCLLSDEHCFSIHHLPCTQPPPPKSVVFFPPLPVQCR